MRNPEVAAILDKYAALLEIGGANRFRVRAYHNAARTIEDLPTEVADMVADGADLSRLRGIGDDLAQKIAEIVDTGELSALEALEQAIPEHLVELTALPGLGPKRVRALYQELGVGSMEDLRRAANARRVRSVAGFGVRTERNLLDAIRRHSDSGKRARLRTAEQTAAPLLAWLRAAPGVVAAEIAGSVRRRRDTIGDLDFVAAADDGRAVIDRFVALDPVDRVVARGHTRATVILRSGMQADLRVVAPESYGAALHYFTGARAHSIALRTMAVGRGLKLNEYGVFRGEARIAGATEAEIFAAFDLPFIAPELREDRGELAAARAGTLPRLITLEDIQGDLHVHSNASDGRDTIAAMAQTAKDRGYRYLAISDHSQSLRVAHGLNARRLARQIGEIDRLNERFTGLRVLKSAEVDILADGSLDLPDELLEQLDLVVCAVHTDLNLSAAKQTERIIRALDNPHVNILAHPTCRLIGRRPPCPVDMERLMRAALARGCVLEINAQPERMDLTDIHCRMAKDIGLKVAISTDAHSATRLDLMRFGVGQARRGWLEADDVVNTRSWPDLKRMLRRN